MAYNQFYKIIFCSSFSSAYVCFFFFTIRNIVSTVNLGCKLDLKTIALRARNAEYNPKVRLQLLAPLIYIICIMYSNVSVILVIFLFFFLAFCCCHYENTRTKDHCSHLQFWENGLYWSKKVRTLNNCHKKSN